MKKIFLLGFVFLLFSTVVVGFVSPVVADGTIYIRSDGSVEGTDKIQRDGNVYTFTDNIHGSIFVERDNIVVDGANFTLQGIGVALSEGIDLTRRSNVTIKNTEIKAFYLGIWLNMSSSNTISGNRITNNSYGIYLESSNDNIISGNNIAKNAFGVLVDDSVKNRIIGNIITENSCWGIQFINNQKNNVIYHNNFINNNVGEGLQVSMPWPAHANIWDNGKEGNYWSDYRTRYPNATEIDGSGIGDTPFFINEINQDRYPLMYYWGSHPPDTTSPTISILSPENKTYTVTDVPLTFTVNESTSSRGYSLDGQANVTITGNTTLTELPDGSHSLIVYANDTAGNTGASETIYFSIKTQQPESFPTTWIVAAIAITAIGGVVILVYFRKIKKTTVNVEKI